MGTLARIPRRWDENDGGDPTGVPAPIDFPTGVINQQPPPVVAPTVNPRQGGGGGGGVGQDFSFPGYDFGAVPQFQYDPFNAPTFGDAQNEPGYQFRLNSGTDSLQRSAAAKGVLRTGGTLKDILEYGQNFGAQEYNNVYNRALSTYDRKYQGQHDAYAPRLAEWQTRAQGEFARANAIYGRGTVWNAPRSGGGGGQFIPPFEENPYGDPGNGSNLDLPPMTPEEERRRRNLTTGFSGYTF